MIMTTSDGEAYCTRNRTVIADFTHPFAPTITVNGM